MTSKPDIGIWIAGASAVAVVSAVIAGLFTVSSPGDARAQRLDSARLVTLHEIATAAQCAYTFTNQIPTSTEEIRAALREHRAPHRACNRVALTLDTAEVGDSISYDADNDEHIRLCAEFLRPSPQTLSPGTTRTLDYPAPFPELQERRAAAGRHCFRVRLVRQTEADPESFVEP